MSQVTTDVLGVKGAPQDAKLLSEFFTRMAADTSTDHRDGVFLPKGVVHLLGPQTYEQVLQENNFFLTNVATIPVNLEHRAWFAIIDPHQTSEMEPVSLHDHLLCKLWFTHIELVTRNKCLILTTKSNLPKARKWIDENLELMICKSQTLLYGNESLVCRYFEKAILPCSEPDDGHRQQSTPMQTTSNNNRLRFGPVGGVPTTSYRSCTQCNQ